MMTNQQASCKRPGDRGVSILMIAVSMIFILGMAGLGIDLASLYVGRSQAQRAADAGALAAANALANDPTCVNGGGGTITADCEILARQRAQAVGDLNLIAGVSPDIQLNTDVTFLSTSSSDPQVQVVASRDTTHNNPMPTFFVKIFGIHSANVSAKAVAEAYTSSGSGPPVGATCVKPWLIPNCDPGNAANLNNKCAQTAGYFVIPQSGGMSSTLARSGSPPNGPVGEPFTMKPGSPGSAAAPGQYYAAFIPDTATAPTQCPACAKTAPGGGGVGSAAVYRMNIECCNQNPIVCGSNTLTLQTTAGNMVGPTEAGVNCLIHQSGKGWPSNCGQDHLSGVTSPCASNPPPVIDPPFSAIAGPNNGLVAADQSIDMSNSGSTVALPIWDGTPLQSGQNSNVMVVGFLQLFIQNQDSKNQGTVYGTIMNVTACGSGGSGNGTGGTGPVIAPGGTSIPVRLIHE